LSFTYDDGNGNTGTVSDPEDFSLIYDDPGDYRVTVTAHDGDGGTRSMSFTITVEQTVTSQDSNGRPTEWEPLNGQEPFLEGPVLGGYHAESLLPFGPASIGAFIHGGAEFPSGHGPGQPPAGSPTMTFTGSFESDEHSEGTGDGIPGRPTPPQPPGNGLTGLTGYYENVLNGQALVFNLDDVHCTDLCTPLGPSEVHLPGGGLTGPMSYLDELKAGKALAFNLNEIDFWALCEEGRG
jgi:PKD repeat protein